MTQPLAFSLQGLRRKLVYVSRFERLAMTVNSTGLAGGSSTNSSLQHASVVAVAMSVIAVRWNLIDNTLFERREARQTVRWRSFQRRTAHAIGFELGFVVSLVPLFAWWLDIGFWHALVLDRGLSLLFLVHTFAFNLGFDQVFGLPTSALPLPAVSAA